MENIVLEPVQQEYVDFMSLPTGVYKNIQYYNNIQGRVFGESGLCKKDGCVYYSHTTFKVKKSKNGYYRQNAQKNGFTLNEKGKLSVWYGKSIFDIPHIRDVFKHMNLNWLNDRLQPYITKGIAEKMLTGKITNNLEIMKAYIKVMRFNCSPRALYHVIESAMFAKPLLLQMLSVAKDQNHMLERCLKDNEKDYSSDILSISSHIVSDMIKQANILGKQIDYTWSSNRMKEQHQQWTKEIMDIEAQNMENTVVEQILPFQEFTYPGFKLLTTQKEVYTEGKTMNHCLYTNYWPTIKHGNYLAYHVDYLDEQATLGLYLSGGLQFNQCYSYANGSISSDLRAYIDKFMLDLKAFGLENELIKEELPF